VGAALTVQIKDLIDVPTKARKRAINKKAQKREKDCANQIGGYTTAASGAGIAKGDARNEKWTIDDKFTEAQSYKLRKSDVIKITSDASKTCRNGALKVGFPDYDVAIVAWTDFLELICD
jgi:ribosomal protein S17E